MLTKWLAQQFFLRNPEILGQFQFDDAGNLQITLSKPDKTILWKFQVSPEKFGKIQELFEVFTNEQG